MAGLDTLQHVGPFQVMERLGFNGAAATYKAMNTAGRKAACVVAIDAAEVADPEAFSAAQSEFMVLRGGVGRRVLRPIDSGQGEGYYWAAYDFVTGRHIGNTVQEIGLPPVGSSFAVGAQVVEALMEFTQTGLSHHGLITPASVFLTETQEIRLLHAGWTRLLMGVNGGVAHPCFMSNLPFVAPEIAAGGFGDIASDVYSLGANLFFLLCGQPVHWADDPAELAALMASKPVDLSPVREIVAEEALELLGEMLELDPMDRPVNLEALHQRIEALASDLPSLPIDPGPSSVTIQRIMSGSTGDSDSGEIPPLPMETKPPARPEPVPASSGYKPPPPPERQAPPPPKREAAPPASSAAAAPAPARTPQAPPASQGIPDEYRKSVESSGATPGRMIIIVGAIVILLAGIGTAMYFVLDAFVFSKAAEVAAPPKGTDAANTPAEGGAGGTTAPGATPAAPPVDHYKVTGTRLEELGKFHRKYIADFGLWPSKLDELKQIEAPEELLKDSWGKDFDLRQEFIVSGGADGKWDTSDDIWFDAKELKLGGKTR